MCHPLSLPPTGIAGRLRVVGKAGGEGQLTANTWYFVTEGTSMKARRRLGTAGVVVLLVTTVPGCSQTDRSSESAPEVQACVREKVAEGMGDSEALNECVEEFNR